MRKLFSTLTTSAVGIITSGTKVIETNLDSINLLSMAGNHAAHEIERESKLDLDKAIHRIEQQEREFLADLEAIDVQVESKTQE